MTAVAVIITALAVWGLLTTRYGLRLRRHGEDSYRSGYADGRRHDVADANEDFFNKRGARR